MSKPTDNPFERIIVALDVDNESSARVLIHKLAPLGVIFKIGLELITAIGAKNAINLVMHQGGKVFYDGKFSDIPNTTGRVSSIVAKQGVWAYNVHSSSGRDSVKAAVIHKMDSLVFVVTVLTSISRDECGDIFHQYTEEKVRDFATDAQKLGVDGIICSPQELVMLGKLSSLDDMLKVTPGVRPQWAVVGDQKRVMTPGDAIRAGATHLVIGRPITAPPSEIGSSVDATERIADEIANVLN